MASQGTAFPPWSRTQLCTEPAPNSPVSAKHMMANVGIGNIPRSLLAHESATLRADVLPYRAVSAAASVHSCHRSRRGAFRLGYMQSLVAIDHQAALQSEPCREIADTHR